MTNPAWFDELTQDLRYALRTLRRAPTFAVVAVLTLALGVGANTAVFGVLDAVLLRPLPYHDPDRLVILSTDAEDHTAGLALEHYAVLREQSKTLAAVAVYFRPTSGVSRATITGGGEPESVQGGFVSATFFPVMGVAAGLGRWFDANEEARAERVVVLSHGLWLRRFGGARDAIGKTLQINGINARVVGVMPETFQFPLAGTQFWAPLISNQYWSDPALATRDTLHTRGFYWRWNVIGRLEPAATPAAAQAEMAGVARRLNETIPAQDRPLELHVTPLRVTLAGNTRLALLMLFGAVCFVLLIACSNLANLVLARGLTRQKEMALRVALGARRARLMRQPLAESAMLAVMGGAAGLVLAEAGTRAIVLYGPRDIPRLEQTGVSPLVFAFTCAISLLAAIVFGVAPAWHLVRSDPKGSLVSGGRGVSDTRSTRRLRSGLIMVEFSLALMLLTGASLLLRSLAAVQALDPGFKPDRVVTIGVTLPAAASDNRKAAFIDQLLDRARALPAVKSVGGIDGLFELDSPNRLGLRAIEGRSTESRDAWSALTWKTVSGQYFEAMGTPLIRGRSFTDQDASGSPRVAIIDASTARRYWPGEDPIGKRFKGQDPRGKRDDWLTVVGVVGDMRRQGLERQPTPHIYEWYRQSAAPTPDIVVRASSNPAAVATALRSAVRALDATAILSPARTLEDRLSDQLAPRRFQTALLGLFSLVAVVLACVGIYGVMQYSVSQRTREIGIRIALGARPGDVARMILTEGLRTSIIGLAAGLVGAWWLGKLLAGLLFSIGPGDPIAFGASSIVLVGVALVGSYVPARRAMGVDPLSALRQE